MDDVDKLFKITCQCCNGYLICAVRNGELLYITFLHAGMSSIVLYPEDIYLEQFLFQWSGSTKIQCIYKRSLKEVNVDNK